MLPCRCRGWFGLSDTLTQSSSRLPASLVALATPPLAAVFASSAPCSGCDWVTSLVSPVCPAVLLELVSGSILGTGMGSVLVLVSSLSLIWSCVTLSEVAKRSVEEPANMNIEKKRYICHINVHVRRESHIHVHDVYYTIFGVVL